MKKVGPKSPPPPKASSSAPPTGETAKTAKTEAVKNEPLDQLQPKQRDGERGTIASSYDPAKQIADAAVVNATPEAVQAAAAALDAIAAKVEDPNAKAILEKAARATESSGKLRTLTEPLRVALKEDPSRPSTLEGRVERKLKGSGDNKKLRLLFRPTQADAQPIPLSPELAEGVPDGARVALELDRSVEGKQLYKLVPKESDFAWNFVADVRVEGGQAFAEGRGLLAPYARLPLDVEDPGSLAGKTIVARVHSPGDRARRFATVGEVVGDASSARAHFTQFAAEGGVELGFSKAALREVDALEAKFQPTGPDYRHLPFVTIDNDDSKDLDQAMAIEKTPTGYRVHYAIADAAHFLDQAPALDAQARRRALTTYLPQGNYPLLPRKLSEGLCSINEGVDRNAFIIQVDLDESGEVIGKRFDFGIVKSRAKLSYRRVQEFHDAGLEGSLAGHEYTPTLALLKEVGEKRIALARGRGVVPSPDLEVRLRVGETGKIEAVPEGRYTSERWNEQISLLSNSAVDSFIDENGAPGLHRVHPTPPEERLEAFRAQVGAIGLPWRPEQTLQGYLEALQKLDPPDRRAKAVSRLSVKLNKAASYQTEPGDHYGLKLSRYGHATAPMRRYIDVETHRIVRAILDRKAGKKTRLPSRHELERIIRRADFAKRRESNIGARSGELMRTAYFAQHLNESRSGTIVEIGPSGFVVELDSPPLTVRVAANDLNRFAKQAVLLDDIGVELRAKGGVSYRLGAQIDVTVVEADIENGQVVTLPSALVDPAKLGRLAG